MKKFQKIIITLLLVIIAANCVSVCPYGSVNYQSLNFMAEDLLEFRSKNSNVFYRITYESGNYKLNCYKIVDQSLSSHPELQIQNFSTKAQKSWEIMTVSQKGSCVGVQQDNTFVTYFTATGQFNKVQSVDISRFRDDVQYNVNDDCSILRIKIVDQLGQISTKVYHNEIQKNSLILPQGSLFTSDYTYAIDTSSNFYQMSNGNYISRKITQLKSIPLYIIWCPITKTLITITMDLNGYTLLVIDPVNQANFYMKTFFKGIDYNGQFYYNIRSSFGQILITDTNGFVTFIDLYSQNSLLVATQYPLEQQVYSSLFNQNSVVSINSDIIFVYNNKKISYFQAYINKIYFLGELSSDLQETGDIFGSQQSKNQINMVLLLASSQGLDLCTPDKPNTTLVVDALDTIQSSANISTTNNIIKCPNNCAACISSEKCTVCRAGYSLDESTGKCIFCHGCLTCSPANPDVCYLCFAPTILNIQTNKCEFPICYDSNCLTCTLAGQCTKCKSGYGLINNRCQKCTINGCKTCSKSLDSCDTNSCRLGYAYYFNKQINKGVCQPCASGCDVCMTTDLTACAVCSIGHFIQKDQNGVSRCEHCFENCQKCTSASTCTKCLSGYIPSTDGSKCQKKCSQHCLTCDPQDSQKCQSCYAGSTLNSSTNKCQVNLSCNSTSTCLICQQQYQLHQGKCYKCQLTQQNCIGCKYDELSTCTQCRNGFYLSNGKCNKCTGNCKSCVSESACAKCNDGYFLVLTDRTGTGKCQLCNPSCKTCTQTSTICTSCNTGYALIGSKCISQNRIILQFVIQANVNNFIQFMHDLMDWIIQQANNGLVVGVGEITQQGYALLKTLPYGSSIVDLYVSAQTAEHANAVGQALNKGINSNPIINGYQIISGSATVQTKIPDPKPKNPIDQITQPQSPSQSVAASSTNMGVIMGIAIPVSIIGLFAVGLVGYKLYTRNKSGNSSSENEQRQQEQRQQSQRPKQGIDDFETDRQRYSNKQIFYSNQSIGQKI